MEGSCGKTRVFICLPLPKPLPGARDVHPCMQALRGFDFISIRLTFVTFLFSLFQSREKDERQYALLA